MQDDNLSPIINAKKALESRRQEKLDEAAILGKRIKALEDALDVMRSTDDEIRQRPVKEKKSRFLDADPELIQASISELISSKGNHARMPQIMDYLRANAIPHSEYSVRKVLTAKFDKVGERDKTYYRELSATVNGGK